MGAPYPTELRERALAALDEGMSKWQVHKVFKISRPALDAWLKRRQETGSFQAITSYRRGPAPAIEDNEASRRFLEAHQHQTLAQMCQAWQAQTGQQLSDVTMSKTLRRLGYNCRRKQRAKMSSKQPLEPNI